MSGFNVHRTETPEWAGDLPCFRGECVACGAVTEEIYDVNDFSEFSCPACEAAAKGEANRRWLEGAELVVAAGTRKAA